MKSEKISILEEFHFTDEGNFFFTAISACKKTQVFVYIKDKRIKVNKSGKVQFTYEF